MKYKNIFYLDLYIIYLSLITNKIVGGTKKWAKKLLEF